MDSAYSVVINVVEEKLSEAKQALWLFQDGINPVYEDTKIQEKHEEFNDSIGQAIEDIDKALEKLQGLKKGN